MSATDIALQGQAKELASRHYEALLRHMEAGGLSMAAQPSWERLPEPRRAAFVAASDEMLRTWIIWAPSGRGVGIQVEEMRARESDRAAMRQWIGGTDADNDPIQERRPE